jgi:hypothetical protein
MGDHKKIAAHNKERSDFLGCTRYMEEAEENGLGVDAAAVAMDWLEQEGLDAFVAFIREQTGGQYPVEQSKWLPVEHPPDIDSIPGRRMAYNMSMDGTSTAGNHVDFLISQDGPFILTHFPILLWQYREGTSRWVVSGSREDELGTFYLMSDESCQRMLTRNWINIYSQPHQLTPLPMSTLFVPNSMIRLNLHPPPPPEPVDYRCILPGYRIVV